MSSSRIGAATIPPGSSGGVTTTPPSLTLVATATPSTANPGVNIAFAASALGGTPPFVYSWNFGDSSPQVSGANVMHAYATTGSFTAVALVTDAAGLQATVQVPVVITPAGTVPPPPPPPSGNARLGFWVDARDVWSGGQYVKPSPSAQQFFNDYFKAAPFPAYLEYVTTLSPTGPYSPGPAGEIQWLGQLAAICDGYPNIQFHIRLFVDTMFYCDGTVKDPTRLALLQSLCQTLAGHRSVVGIQEEPEYVVSQTGTHCTNGTPQLSTAFIALVHSFGMKAIAYQPNATFDMSLDFNRWPSYTDPIVFALSKNSIGISWGDPGATFSGQSGANPPPVWTQASVTTIIDKYTIGGHVTILQAWQDGSNPAGGVPGAPLWHSSIFRSWIANDPNYIANYLESGA